MKGKLIVLTLLFVIAYVVSFFGYLQSYHFNPQISNNKIINYAELDPYQPIQVVLVVVDALRFEFAKRIPYFQEMAHSHPTRAHLQQLHVAQPTYTVTNVKAILTGSNPFEYGKIYEMLYERRIAMDNVASQLISNGNQTLMMGDNVWNKTFEFTSTDYSCDRTFDIYQRKLTCQENIYLHFDSVVKQKLPNSSYAAYPFIVTHLLEIDHSTHANGVPNNPYLTDLFEKLQTKVRSFTDAIEEETFLIVMGDHGTQQNGMHSGITSLQMEATLFSYYKANKATLNEFYQENKPDNFNLTVKTLDLASTLSLLLNTNLPSNSFGFPILDILPVRFHKYFAQIELNVLKSYKKNINFYGIQQDNKCHKINEWITDSEQHQSTIQPPRFYYERREKIIDDLYQNCLVEINLAKPFTIFWFALPLLIFLMVVIWLNTFPAQQRKLTKIFIMAQVACFGTKFLISFSENFIYAQIPYLQLVLIGLILFEDSITKKIKIISIALMAFSSLFEVSYLDVYYHSLFYIKSLSTFIDNSQNLVLVLYFLWSGHQIHTIIRELKTIPIPKRQKKKPEQPYRIYIKNLLTHKIKTKVAFLCVAASNGLSILIIILTFLNQIHSFQNDKSYPIRILVSRLILITISLRIVLHVLRLKYKKEQQLHEISNESNAKLYFRHKFNHSVLIISIYSIFFEKQQFALLLLLQLMVHLLNKNKINFLISYIVAEITWRQFGILYQLSSIKVSYSFVFGQEFDVTRCAVAYVMFFSGMHFITLSEIYRNISNKTSNSSNQLNSQSDSTADIKTSQRPTSNNHNQTPVHDAAIKQAQPQSETQTQKPEGKKAQFCTDQSSTEPQQQPKPTLDQTSLANDQTKENQNNFLIKKSDKVNQQLFWNQLGKYLIIPIAGVLSTTVNLAIRTGTMSSMFYTILMIVESFQLAFVPIVLLALLIRGTTKLIDQGIGKLM